MFWSRPPSYGQVSGPQLPSAFWTLHWPAVLLGSRREQHRKRRKDSRPRVDHQALDLCGHLHPDELDRRQARRSTGVLDPEAVLYGHRCPNGNTQRKVLRTGRRHQQSAEQLHSTAPMPSTNRPMIAKSRYKPSARPTRRFMTPTYGDPTAAGNGLSLAPRAPECRATGHSVAKQRAAARPLPGPAPG